MEGLLGQPWSWTWQVPPKHRWAMENFMILQYCPLPLGVCCPTFQDHTVVSSSRVKCPTNLISSLDIHPLKMRSPHSLKIFGNKHLVTEHNIPDGWRTHLPCSEGLNTSIGNCSPIDTICLQSKHLGYLINKTCIPLISSLEYSQVTVHL